MKKFILLSFGFLGWAFYEMSGGADFESASDRRARLSPAPEVSETVIAKAETAPRTQPAAVASDDAEVTRVSLNLTRLQDAVEAEDPAAEEVQTETVVASTDTAPANGVPVTDPTITDSASTPAIIPSLIAPNDGAVVQNASLATSSGADVREVTGNRVNVRGGPGTNFGVVTKLVRGDAVEILQDNGDGWVRMRPVSGGPEGWMADFLLTAG